MLYFIDITENDTLDCDADGIEVADVNEAAAAAAAILPEIAREALLTHQRVAAPIQAGERYFAAQVRDTAGRILFRTCLRLETDWPSMTE